MYSKLQKRNVILTQGDAFSKKMTLGTFKSNYKDDLQISRFIPGNCSAQFRLSFKKIGFIFCNIQRDTREPDL